LAAGDITVAITVSGTLVDGNAIAGFGESKVFSSVADVREMTITLPATTLVTLLAIGATVSGQTLLSALQHLTLYNMDATANVRVGFLAANGAQYLRLDAGEMFSTMSDQLEAFAGETAFSAFETITSITLYASAACKIKAIAF